MRWSMTLFGLAAILAGACSGDGGGSTAPGAPGAIAAVSGDAQTDTVVATLANPLVVKVTDKSGNPLPGATVNWLATVGGGAFDSSSTRADATGLAKAKWTLGATPGNQTSTATVAGLTAVTFHATATVGTPYWIGFSGEGQLAPAGTAVAAPLLVQLKDKFGNPVPGVTISWTVVSGGGSLSATTVTTDPNGQAQVTWTLGPSTGSQSAKATSGALSATFTATAI